MSLAVVYSRAQVGVQAPLVTVEVHMSGGVPRWSIAGLPAAAVRESEDRVRAALMSCGYEYPHRHITVNLAPADMPKEGGRFDLPIAVGILAASHQIRDDLLADHELVAELGLSGEARATGGVLPAALAARDARRALVVAHGDADEAGLVDGARVLPTGHLRAVIAHLNTGDTLHAHVTRTDGRPREPAADLAEVRGQYRAKRALEIAAAGGHNLLMIGPPGTGKTMLATRLPGILPPMSEDEAMQSATVLSVSGRRFELTEWARRPFRAPHHTASAAALVGGGARPRPGEISLAHNGVLFLDELPEFDRRVLEALREPLESGRVTIARARYQAEFPALFQLVAAMNPCPCGHLGDAAGECRCNPDQIRRYRARISGPLLDRIDLHVEVPPLPPSVYSRRDAAAEPSADVRARVAGVRARQVAERGCANRALAPARLERLCRLAPDAQRLLEAAIERLHLSARARHRVLRVALTIAELAGADAVAPDHVSEAVQYRSLDRDLPD